MMGFLKVLMEQWEAFENLGNEIWFYFYAFCNGNEVVLNVVVPSILMITVYWIVSAFFIFVDITGKPHFVVKFKIPDSKVTKYPRLTEARLQAVCAQVLLNQTVVSIPVVYFCYLLRSYIGYNKEIRLPKPHIFVFDIAAQMIAEEIFFYYSHRFLHHPRLYKRFHKKHHEWIHPIGVSAIYCHPVEQVLTNVLPTYMGAILAGTHVISMWGWLSFATAAGVFVHSGYHLPFTPTPEFHQYHHLKFNENFGVAGILDWLHGTDKEYRKTEAYKRDVVLLSLTPFSTREDKRKSQPHTS